MNQRLMPKTLISPIKFVYFLESCHCCLILAGHMFWHNKDLPNSYHMFNMFFSTIYLSNALQLLRFGEGW